MKTFVSICVATLLLCSAVGYAVPSMAAQPETKSKVQTHVAAKTRHVTKSKTTRVRYAVGRRKPKVTRASVRTEQARTIDLNRQSLENARKGASGGSL
jgi:hypothetical protein